MIYKTPTFAEPQQYNRPFSWGHISARNAPQALVSGKKNIPRYYKIRYDKILLSNQGAESLVIYITQKNNKHSNT
jgi:hypothetical protein